MVEARYLSVRWLVRRTIGADGKEISPKHTVYCLKPHVGLQENMLQTVTCVKRYRSFAVFWFVYRAVYVKLFSVRGFFVFFRIMPETIVTLLNYF